MSRIPVVAATMLAIGLSLGCGKKDVADDSTGATQGMLMGTVRDVSGSFIAGAAVRAGGLSTTTNSQGYFSLAAVPAAERLVVRFGKSGYVSTSNVTAIQQGEASYIAAVLAPTSTTTPVSAATGGTVSTNGAAVTLPANQFVNADGSAYSGWVSVALTPFDPSTPGGIAAFPGDFEGVQSAGGTVPIESFGFIDVTLADAAGAKLQLAPGSTATIVIPVAASLLATAPASISLWYFDDVTGKWYEEGSATLSGSSYTGVVSHFTAWNVDMPRVTSWVKGRVVDSFGPVRGARVTVLGANWQSGESSTPDDGTFRIPVGSSRSCTLFAAKNGIESDHHPFTSAAVGLEYDIGDVFLGVPVVKVALSWGADPADLDSHLTFPSVGGGRGHVYYSNKAEGNVTLDTDDTDGFGPEITTVVALTDGVYRYSVHHYSGAGTISSSSATVSMVVDRMGIYTLTPPSGATGEDDAWLCWDIVVANGQVTDVQTLNRYVPNVSAGDTAAFSP